LVKVREGNRARVIARLDAANARLERENESLRERNRVVEQRLARLEHLVESIAPFIGQGE
jgi:hypothetical protein